MKLSQQQLAEKMRITRNWLALLESGREPSEALRELFERIEAQWKRGEIPIESEFSDALTEPTESVQRVREEPERFGGGRAKLKAARIAKGLSVKELCKAVGYSELIYKGIEDGSSNMSRKMAQKVAQVLDIDVSELLDGSDHPPANGVHHGTVGETPDIVMPPGQKARFIPLLSMAQCGTMMAYDDTAYDHSGFIALNPKDGKAFAVTLAGDSMTPDFKPGDTAMVYPSFEPRNNSVVIARLREDHGGDVMLKLYQKAGTTVTLSSYNPAYPPMSFQHHDFLWIYPVASVTRLL